MKSIIVVLGLLFGVASAQTVLVNPFPPGSHLVPTKSGGGSTTAYSVPAFTGSPQTITAATHGQGKDAIAICWFGTLPSTWTNCGLTNADPSSASAGNIVLTYAATPSRVVIYTPGQGAPGQQGNAGSGNNAYCADATGSTTAYTCPTPSPTVTTYTGLLLSLVPQTTNTGSSTVNVSGLGVKTLKQSDCSTNLAASAMTGGVVYQFAYNGTVLCQVSAGSAAAGAAGVVQASNGSGNLQATSITDNGTTVVTTEPLSAKSFTGTDTSVSSGMALNGLTSGTVQLSVADVAGTAISYVLPSTNGTAGQFLEDSGSTTCPTLAAGSPATCHLLKWTSAVQTCGTTSSCSHTALTSPQIVMGSAALVTGTPSTVTITGISPAFTSSSSYVCTIAAQTTATTALLSVANVSGSSFTITGPNADTRVVNYVCVGN